MKRPGPTIDVHAHFFPEAFLRVIEEVGGAFGARVDRSSAKGPAIVTAAGRTPPLEASYWDLDLRRRAMDRQGVDVHALSLTSPMVYFADGQVGERLARSVNDAMIDAHTAFPGRFVGCATLPMQEPKRAIAELERVGRSPAIRGVYLGTNVNGRDLSDPEFFPVLERIHALRQPLLLHPLTVVGAARLAPFYLHNLLGNPFDTAIAAAHLVLGRVLDRLPRLQVCLPHAGGALPYLFGRVQHGQAVRPENRGAARHRFGAYLRRFTYDTISHSPEALRYLIGLVGADRVMIGSDYCFDMGYREPRDMVVRQLRLGPADRARILGGNAARLLRFR